MTSSATYNLVLYLWLGMAAVSFLLLLFVTAPYGRHARSGWGPTVSNRVGWIVMESPTLVAFNIFWWMGDHATATTSLILYALWHLHYINRTLIFPFRIRGDKDKRMPALVMLSGVFFNLGNAYLQAVWITDLSGGYSTEWLTDPRFFLGAAIFLFGFAVNYQSDDILRNLRKPGETGYKIPRGGFYRFVSSPNYFGEVVEWTGWAIATWSIGGAAFAIWTAANLVPRAISNHKWYLDKFKDDYPRERRAVFPYLL